MSTGELLNIEPTELKFPCGCRSNLLSWSLGSLSLCFLLPLTVMFLFLCVLLVELKKQISCALRLSNKTDHYVAFKVKTTNPKKYSVRPNSGIVLPRSTCDVVVTMQAQREAPPDMQCKDKFLLQSVKANDGMTAKDITAEMFNKEAENVVEDCKLRVIYVSPPRPPSPVWEGSEEGSPTRDSIPENDSASGLETRALIVKLIEEKNSATQQTNKLREEMELLRRGVSQKGGGVSLVFVVIIGILGVVLGFLMRKI
ncbi:hypothetical protein SAY86_029489 [Trapa natans]|uniref:MSP domain-containing protein n=1 Tax=Trapa natans TaxID=22666 RepID=A0AAN7RHE2_TRANT|nr:hypothetical protein SAY86_029489 [Trapa natans]